MKNILIDGFNLSLDKGTGVATYSRNLSYALKALGYEVSVLYGSRSSSGIDSLLKEISFFDSNAGNPSRFVQLIQYYKELFYSPYGFTADKIPLSERIIKDTFKSKLPKFDHLLNCPNLYQRSNRRFRWYNKRFKNVNIVGKNIDLAHWTYPLPLRIKGARNIYTLHDLVPLRLPYTTLDNKKRYYKLLKLVKSNADHIVTVSENSKKDLVEILGIDESRITNTYQSVFIPPKYSETPEEEVQRTIEGTFGFDYKGYFLFFGSIEPKKNIGRIIESYLSARVDSPLVIIGAQAWKSDQELKLLYDDHNRFLFERNNLTSVRKKVYQIDYVPFPLLVSLIRGAKSVLFPSLYEGFGLPVLESMLLKTPVLTSNVSSVPEIAGNAAYMVNPYESREITEGIIKLENDKGLRDELIKKGSAQVEKYTEDKYQERMSDLYDKLL